MAPASGEPRTLPDLFARADPEPGRVLLETPAGRRITYGDAAVATARLAGALRDVGVVPGDRVAVQVEKSPEALLLWLACLRAGAVLVPMNVAYTDDEVAFLLGDAAPRLLVTDAGRAGRAARCGVPEELTLGADGSGTLADRAAAMPEAFADVPVRPDDLTAILYTSGTTGRPKGAMLTQWNLASNVATLHRLWGFRPDDVLLHALPLFHTHGLFVAAGCVLANGTGMVLLPRFDVDDVLELLPRVTVLMGVPTFYTRLLDDPRLDRARCAQMRLFVSGSAPLLASTHAAFRERTGHAILERYGMTETSMLTSNPLAGERRPGSVGFPLAGVELRVVDPATGMRASAGEVGDLEVHGANVCVGYWGRPDAFAAEITADGFFRTGDLGFADADGYLHLVGRSKDLVISGGLNVYPKEVEDVLDALHGVHESAVVGVPDADLGEAVVAVVVAEPGVTLDPEALRAACRVRLAGFKVPRRVHVVDALPRNTMGKVEKVRLREHFAAPAAGT